MKFHVVERSDGYLYGKMFEEPYRYSEYTHGGGDFYDTFVPREALTDNSNTEYHVAIFESKEAAQNIVDNYIENYIFFNIHDYTYKVVSLLDLEKDYKND